MYATYLLLPYVLNKMCSPVADVYPMQECVKQLKSVTLWVRIVFLFGSYSAFLF